MFSAIVGFFGRVFGGDKAVAKTLEMVDEAVFTDQEKTENKTEIFKLKVDAKKDLLKHFEAFKLAQRGLVFLLMFSVMVLIITSIVFISIGWGSQLDRLLSVYGEITTNTLVIMVFGFYFAGGVLSGVVNKK
jgi:hypothetical protein